MSNPQLIDLWETFLPRFRSLVAPLLHEPNRVILLDDWCVRLNDETFHELGLSYLILRPHALTFKVLLSTPLDKLTKTFLTNILTASTALLREAERNVNVLQYSPGGRRWRSVYSYTAVLVAIAILALLVHEVDGATQPFHDHSDLVNKKVDNWSWQDIIYHLDFAIIKTAGWPIISFVHEFLGFMDTVLLPLIDKDHNLEIDWDRNDDQWCPWVIPSEPTLRFPGKQFNSPSIAEWRDIYSQKKPVKLTGILDHWPVFDVPPNGIRKSKWASFQYLLSKTTNGRRIVPVEIGRTYADPDLKQRILTFKYFFSNYFLSAPRRESAEAEEGVFGYLAQHNLLTQIPSLRNDVCVPEYINYTETSSSNDDEEDTDVATTINAWFGPANTITPLHTDNYFNIFCQVVGRKYVRLYPPNAREAMRPMGIDERGIDMGNTSSIPINWVEEEQFIETGETGDAERWEKFKNEQYVEFVVEPGEAVFFPKGWWHYVRSVEASFSVNFWWGA
ncbi:hypothetical protein TWF730_004530 [Orbilia blumenaviensis]|uniref:JmjC domain-containing protein n=1 Tax=Orbilia blumenaviensis TaxID=1796055 RepID=A0AAV9U2R9_9PEZI